MGATVRITPTAWMKMQTLVMGYNKEVGWFGTCERVSQNEYRIKDILIFPQYTSGCFVDDERDDPLEFRKWLDTLSDEDYNSRRLWGHSHVNMGTSPSGTDNDMFKRFAHTSCAPGCDNNFAICLILNKRCDMYWWVYDGETNKEYNNKEISAMIEVDDAGTSNLEYYEASKSMVRDILSTTSFLYNTSSYGGSYYGGSYGSYGGVNREPAKSYNYGAYNTYANQNKEKAATTQKPVVEVKKTETPAEKPSKPEPKKETYYDDWEEWERVFGGCDYDDDYYPLTDAHTYDVEITEDSIEVTKLFSDAAFDYKNDIILEDEVTGDEYRFMMTDKPLVEDHPVQNDSLASVLLDMHLASGANYFRMWQETDDEHVVTVLPEDEEDVCELMTMFVGSVEVTDGVIEVTFPLKEKEGASK